MSYKLNLKNPERKIEMNSRRLRRWHETPTPRPQQRNVVGISRAMKPSQPAYITTPKKGNKYILSGSKANVRSPCDVIWE